MTENGKPPTGRTVQIGGQPVTIERVGARKASRAFAILRGVSDKLPAIVGRLGEAAADYERTHYIELDRAQAWRRYGAAAPLVEDGELVRDKDGNAVTIPSGLASMTEEDWQAAGHKLRVPQEAPDEYKWAAVFDRALELAEDHVYALLALLTMSNDDVKAAWRGEGLEQAVADRVDELLDDAYADELLELAVVCGEVVDDQFRAKVRSLGASRLGNALRLLGIDPTKMGRQTPQEPTQTTDMEPSSTPPTSTETPSTTTPGSPGGSGASSDGPPTTPSTPPSSSSPPSEPASTTSGPG